MRKLAPFLVIIVGVVLMVSPAWAESTQDRLASLESQVAELTSLVDQLNRKLDGLSDVEALTKQITQMQAQIRNLETKVAQGGGGPTQEQETAARALVQEIQNLVKQGETAEAKTKLATLMSEYSATRIARGYGQNLQRELAVVGKDVPGDWPIEMWFQGGEQVDFTDGRPTLLVFWETWCPHCRREVPKLQELYEQYRDRGLQVVALTRLTRSSTEENVRSLITDHSLTYPIAKESGTLSSHFGVRGIPAAAVVKDGKIVWRGHPANLTDQALSSWL